MGMIKLRGAVMSVDSNEPYRYYDYENMLCRVQGDIFEGNAEMYVKGKGFQKGNLFKITEGGFGLTKKEFEKRMLEETKQAS